MDEDDNLEAGASRPRKYFKTQSKNEGDNWRRPVYNPTSHPPFHNYSDPRSKQNWRHTNSNHTRGQLDNRYQFMGLASLEIMGKMKNTSEIVLKINEHRKGFMDLLNAPIHKLDVFALIIEVLAKVSQSPFEEMNSKLFLDVCNSNFITCLRNYLIDLPYTVNKLQNEMYWKDQNTFWKNFITFCRYIVDISPGTAVRKCRALIENISKICLEYLNQRHAFVLLEGESLRMEDVRNKLINYSAKCETANREISDVAMKPPNDFRELSVIPTREDLFDDAQPFLRPNLVNGAYSDIEHYLDVQFRLLREDCFGPIRIGVNQYLADPSKRKYDHVRVFRNVKFIGPYINNLKVGTLVQIDTESNKYLKRINWAHNKKLLFGSLVLFTKNNLSEFIVATILDRDNLLLSTGKLAVSIIDSSCGGSIHQEASYTMIESEVYYEPYNHVLKALQEPTFPIHLPLQQYIVKVNFISDHGACNSAEISESHNNIIINMPATNKPAYLTNDKQFVITDLKEKFTVLEPETWPTKEKLKFNESQYEAYKLALTHELAVIQGPPGTGKTYVGLSVAKTLLRNIKSDSGCLMLVICYTNHALDQFLEGISHVTDKIVRIGGQSRNEAMDKFNLANLRKSGSIYNSYFMKTKTNLKQSIGEFQDSLLLLDIFNHGIVSCDVIQDVNEIQYLCNYYEQFPYIKNPLMHWLFENHTKYYSDFNAIILEYDNLTIDNNENEYNNKRTEYIMMCDDDNYKKNHMENSKKRLASFLITDAKLALKNLVAEYLDTRATFKQKMHTKMGIKDLHSKINLFADMVKHRSRQTHLNITIDTNFSRIAPHIRWQLYFMWIEKTIMVTKQKVADFQQLVAPSATVYEETRMILDMELIRKNDTEVLGLTTSGAAKMRKLLKAVSPKIVIVEEAAEVLEQHIISSLTVNCQHLILIGDHQQLRPSASYLKLAKQYNMEVSLFERMITNGIHSRRLNVQHRMRPEIAALISPHIYPELENHPSVENFSNVPGLEKNVFFFSHEYREQDNFNDSNSRVNHKEADLTLALANYIMQQGYESHEVTILAAYSGQMFYMKKERQKYACLNNVKITVVDNYQGEESRIILLSLVRNNPDNIIGFLGFENRICVALSRAKQGFYMFGNINMLKMKSELWRNIAGTLESNGSVGTVLNLKCRVHPDQITPVVTAEDFVKVPEGGCLKKCNYQYSCGHCCKLYCHGYDREHVTNKCPEPCERILCDLGHVCPLMCKEDCGKCKVYVLKTLPCSHEMEIFCHHEPEDPRNKCLIEIDAVLPICGHKAKKKCFMDIEKVKCIEKCKHRLENCGHVCVKTCHEAFSDHENIRCRKDCVRKKKGCMAESSDDSPLHQCKKACYEQCDNCNVQVKKKRANCQHVARIACCVNIDDTLCEEKCTRKMDCGHYCKKKCSEPCGDCKKMVTKVIPDCNHSIEVECQTIVTRKDCRHKCERTLSCGHPCKSACSAECDETNCKKPVTTQVDSPCGHKVNLPCNLYSAFNKGEIQLKKLLKYCKNPCGEELACGHICNGSCSQCYQGRLHAPCKQTCHQINICGHQCQEPCNQICPPCNVPCEVQCLHSRCGRICGEPCVECQEKCSRSCPHSACSRLCSAPCSRAPCGEACARALACGHRCRGVCGEPCPPVCRACRPDTFPTDFLGDEYGEQDKFILLQDCGHVLELETMDNLMMGDQENIQIRQCPFCRKPIINTNRYKDLVNKLFKNDINPIKERVYGKNTEIDVKLKELKAKVKSTYLKCLRVHDGLETTFTHFVSFLKSQKKMHLLQIEMLLIYCDIIEMITECWKEFLKTDSIIIKEEMEEYISIILKVLKIDLKSKIPIKISEQQQRDIRNEMKRLNSLVQLANLLQAAVFVQNDPTVKTHIEAAKNVLFTLSLFDEDKAVECLKELKATINSSAVISKLDRQMVVNVVGVKAGHWYKCPNGHFYCIDRCGGATVVSKCPDCGASIGGTNHALLRDNAHAPEMDGSQFPAYSEQANMANFLIN